MKVASLIIMLCNLNPDDDISIMGVDVTGHDPQLDTETRVVRLGDGTMCLTSYDYGVGDGEMSICSTLAHRR